MLETPKPKDKVKTRTQNLIDHDKNRIASRLDEWEDTMMYLSADLKLSKLFACCK